MTARSSAVRSIEARGGVGARAAGRRPRVRHAVRPRSRAVPGAAGASASQPVPPWPGRSGTIARNRPPRPASPAHERPLPENPWSSRTGRPAPGDPDRPGHAADPHAEPLAHDRLAPSAAREELAERGLRPRPAASRWSATLRARSVRSSRTWRPGAPSDAARAARSPPASTTPMLGTERRHDRPEVDPVRRPEELLVALRQPGARRVGRRLGKEREDPAAVVVHEDDRRREPVEPGGDAARRGRGGSDRSPTTSATRAPAAAAPSADETTPSMPFAPRFARGRTSRGPGRQPGVDVADRHRAARPQDRAVGQEVGEVGEGRALERLAGLRRADQPAPQGAVRGTVGGQPRVEPAGAARRGGTEAATGGAPLPAAEGVRQRVRRRGRVGVHEGRRDDRRLAPAAVAVDDQLRRPSLLEQGEKRLRRRHRAEAHDEVRRVGVAPRAGAQQQVAPGHHARAVVRAAADPGERVGEDRPAEGGGEAGQGGRQRRVVLRPGHEEPALDGAQPAGEARDGLRVEGPRPGDDLRECLLGGGRHAPRPRARRAACGTPAATGPRGPSGMSGSRNGTLTWTGPAGPARAVATARAGHGSRLAPGDVLPVEERQLGEPLARGSRTGAPGRSPGARRGRAAPAGRSAVSTTSGTRPSVASTTAGSRFAAAVPEVTTIATGRRAARARPSAKKPALRSSSRTRTEIPGWARSARASGVDREPGQTTASRKAAADQLVDEGAEGHEVGHRPSSSSRPRAEATGRSLIRDSSHSRRRIGVGDDPAAREERGLPAGHEPAAERDHQLAVAVGAQPADRPGVPAALEALVLGDQVEGQLARLAAHGGGRVEPPG